MTIVRSTLLLGLVCGPWLPAAEETDPAITVRPLGHRPILVVRAPAEEPADDPIRRRLRARISVSFHQIPVTEAIATLSRSLDLNMVVDNQVRADPPIVELDVKDMPADSILRWLMRQTGLHQSIMDEAVFISREPPRQRYTVKLVDVSDLVLPITDFPGPRMSLGMSSPAGGVDPFVGAPPAGEARSTWDVADLAKIVQDQANQQLAEGR